MAAAPTLPRAMAAAAIAAAAPLLLAADGEGWPEAPQPNITESVVEFPLEQENSFTYNIPLGSFLHPVRTEDVAGGVTTVTVSSDILFDFDEAELTERAEETITELAAEIQGTTGTVDVVGHTDGVGEADYNRELSEERAEAVAEALAAELGEDAAIEPEGRGSEEPVAQESGDSEEQAEARALNRRVEISYEGS